MHWSKIEDIDNTFWRDVPNEALVNKLQQEGVLDKVEKAFVAKAPVIKSRPKAEFAANLKPVKITLLSRDLAQQFGINLHMFATLSVDELFEKILRCDADILSNGSVLEFFCSDALNDVPDSLCRLFAPYSQDYAQPKLQPLKSSADLERADQIFLQIHNMRHYWKSRARALLLMQSYRKDFNDLEQKLNLVDEASAKIRGSTCLRQVLAIIRSVGNFMNDDLKRAMGFKLDVLQRLKFMKDDSNTLTFLHYVEKIVRNNFPEYGSFVDELSVLNRMHKIVVEQLETDCQDYARNVANAATSIEKGNLSLSSQFHPKDQILTVLKGPLDNAQHKSTLLQSHLQSTLAEYRLLMKYFGENPDDATSKNSFFGKFAGFVVEYKRAHLENVQKEEDERIYEEKKQSIERRENARRKTVSQRESIQSEKIDKESNRNTSNINDNDQDEENEEENDDNVAEEDEDDGNEIAATANVDTVDGESEDVIDKLLRELKCLGSDRKKRTRSMYIKGKSASLQKVPIAQDDADMGRYELVNTLRRRMTSRKFKSTDALGAAEDLDVVMLRAQAMLSQLRTRSADLDVGGEKEIQKEEEKGETTKEQELSPKVVTIDVIPVEEVSTEDEN